MNDLDRGVTARALRELNLLKATDKSLQVWLAAFDRPVKGEREELIERLHKTIWDKRYD